MGIYMKSVIIPPSAAGERLSDWLISNRHAIRADCGGRGTCGKCRVTVTRGEFIRLGLDKEAYLPDTGGGILSCRALCPEGGAEILLPETEGEGLVSHASTTGKGVNPQSSSASRRYGIALDIGTTTLAASLTDLTAGTVVDHYSCLNPQRVYGADVITRITACREGHLDELCRLIRQKTAEIIEVFVKKHPDKRPDTLTVAGNTTMMHIFCGVSPVSIGVYPFTPAFTEGREYSGIQLGVPVERVILLSAASAYIGSDVTGGVLECGMTELEGPSALIDVGTNGEIVLSTGRSRGGRLIAASSAAGPALEGANISCGVGGIPGAVCHVGQRAGGIGFSTIGDRPPVGICGCGLIDLIASLLDAGVIDETGYMEDGDYPLYGAPGASALHVGKDGGEIVPAGGLASAALPAPLVLSQRDVREFQLAKSALRAAFDTLLGSAGIEVGELERIFIAGGLGYYMSIPSAIRTGLLPSAHHEKFSVVGNTSLAGAEAALFDLSAPGKISKIAGRCEILELNSLPDFSELFMQNMTFPDTGQ